LQIGLGLGPVIKRAARLAQLRTLPLIFRFHVYVTFKGVKTVAAEIWDYSFFQFLIIQLSGKADPGRELAVEIMNRSRLVFRAGYRMAMSRVTGWRALRR